MPKCEEYPAQHPWTAVLKGAYANLQLRLGQNPSFNKKNIFFIDVNNSSPGYISTYQLGPKCQAGCNYLGIHKLQNSELDATKCHILTLFNIASALHFLPRRNRLDDFNEVHKFESDKLLGSGRLRSITAAELLVGVDG